MTAPTPRTLVVVAAPGYEPERLLAGTEVAIVPAADRLDDAAWARTVRRLSEAPRQGQPPRGALLSGSPLSEARLGSLPGPVQVWPARSLSLDLDQVATRLGDLAEHALTVWELTAGWPALVDAVGDLIGRTPLDRIIPVALDPANGLTPWLVSHVLGPLTDRSRHVLSWAAHLPLVTPDLLVDLGVVPPQDVAAEWARITQPGLATPLEGGDRVVPLLAVLVRQLGPTPEQGLLRRAAQWYSAHDLPAETAAVLSSCGEHTRACAVLEEHGLRLLDQGRGATVLEVLDRAASCVEGSALPFRLRITEADARRRVGDVRAAERAWRPLLADDVLPAAVAWRAAMVPYQRAAYDEAYRLLARAAPAGSRATRDDVEVEAGRSQVATMQGHDDLARTHAQRALALAEEADCDQALLAAHLAAANAHTGVARDEHLAAAENAARGCGDPTGLTRTLVNQGFGLLARADYRAARTVSLRAVKAARIGAPPGLHVMALHNLGEAERRLGEHDAATVHLQQALALCRRHGLRRVSFGLWGLAEVHRACGRHDLALTVFAEAVEAARTTGELQVLVPALAGRAMLLRDLGRWTEARQAAEEAVATSTEEFLPTALVARGWTRLPHEPASSTTVLGHADDRDAALADAEQALAGARALGEVDQAASAWELYAAASTRRAEAVAACREALAIWSAGGAEPCADRVRLRLADLEPRDPVLHWEARRAENRLRVDPPTRGVEVDILGGFAVRVGGEPVPAGAWRSKQARSLVKVLAAKRGRIVSRAEICELMWPDDDPARTGHRLSVLLSSVRGVLDPQRSRPVDHVVAADAHGLWLDLAHVRVDADELLRESAHAADLLRTGDLVRAEDLMRRVVTCYQGEPLPDEPEALWAVGLREEVRAAWLRALFNLAELMRRHGAYAEAVPLLVRLLGEDPYDETAHRCLVRTLGQSGRHGEARRALARWQAAMREIDVAIPDARVLVLTPS